MAKEKAKKFSWKDLCMSTKNCEESNECKGNSGMGGALYGLGFIGALVYNVQTAVGIVGIFIGILKSIVWPVFVVYGLLKFLGM
ncbi:MAG: hypothetical protein WC821_04730 [archaeon]|jgi:hypothetical protein